MELVEGCSLGAIVDDTGPLPPAAVARLGAGISLGLAAIHAQGIIHRDIKPDNILLGRDRKPKITDLGLAKQTDEPDLQRLTATGMVVGTPLYVSPENIRDPKSAGSAADIYSLGATLYHLLTGRPPFTEHTPYEVMRAHLESRVQPIRELAPGVPIGLAQLVERCLSKRPGKRPSAIELADRLSQGASLTASPVGGLALMVALTALVVAALSAAAWFALEAGRRHAAGASRPAHEQARSVAASYHNAPLSYEMAGHLDYLGGGPLKALLILLPSEPGAAR
jgi:serine/threonine-protein kinase